METLPGLLAIVRPELVLFNAGVDVHADDALGKMALTDAGEHAHIAYPPTNKANAGPSWLSSF